MTNLSLQFLPEDSRYLEVSLLLIGMAAGYKTSIVIYNTFCHWYYIPQPGDLLSIHSNIDEMTVNLKNYLNENSLYILPDNLNDLDTQSRYDQLVNVYDNLKFILKNFEFVRCKLEIIRESILPAYIDQYNLQYNTVSKSCALIVDTLRDLESHIISNNPDFVTLALQASEIL